ncbi:hypothetical protein AGMMS50268_36460 [Spirochaetia bacterium]|nr:hypothetical protein AGMMS50268_36460 [Spirochaetia bacterium]
MTKDLSKAKIYIRPGHTDMRKAVNGLTLLVKEKMEQDPANLWFDSGSGEPKVRND